MAVALRILAAPSVSTPKKLLLIPEEILLPAFWPIATLVLPVVLPDKALYLIAVLLPPVVLPARVPYPIPVFLIPLLLPVIFPLLPAYAPTKVLPPEMFVVPSK